MAEQEVAPGEVGITLHPIYINAVYREGYFRPTTYDRVTGKDMVPVFDVGTRNGRLGFALENLGAFSDGSVPNPERVWLEVLNAWIYEQRTAGRRTGATGNILKEIDDSERELIAMTAVSTAARAMEKSGGAHTDYVTYVSAGGQGPRLGAQDDLKEYILADDPDKLNLVLNNPLVAHYTRRLLGDAGIDRTTRWHREEGRWVASDMVINLQRARDGRLVRYLRDEAQRGGFKEYIRALVSADTDEFKGDWAGRGITESGLRAAARIACDAFMADFFTRYEFQITGGVQGEQQLGMDELKLFPTRGWGGDPFRALLETSYLPQRIKGVYNEPGDELVMDIYDRAFRPEGEFESVGLKNQLLTASAAGNLKRYFRLLEPAWLLIGGKSLASGLPQWTPEIMGKTLPEIADYIFQVYGGLTVDRRGLPNNIGKHIIGKMMSLIILAKASAAAQISQEPGFWDQTRLFGDLKANNPWGEVVLFLWGPYGRGESGFLADLQSAQRRFVFADNRFGADKDLLAAKKYLETNAQTKAGQRRGQAAAYIETAAEMFAAATKLVSK